MNEKKKERETEREAEEERDILIQGIGCFISIIFPRGKRESIMTFAAGFDSTVHAIGFFLVSCLCTSRECHC